MRPVQHFTPEYLERCKGMSAEETLRFLDNYRQLHAGRAEQKKPVKSKLISMKVPEDLLQAFRQQCEMDGVKYQTKIKELMREYLQQ